nr:hypothetical protein [Methylibium sp.]
MKRQSVLIAFLCSAALGLPFAASAQTTPTMSSEQYGTAKDEIDARYKA